MSEQPTSTEPGGIKPPSGIFDRTPAKAQVVLINNTSSDLVGASIVHKYSDDTKDHHSWGIIKPGERSSPMTVNYITGTFTTGRSWWVVQFATGKWFCYTDPKNLRSIVDFLEGKAPFIVSKLVGIAARLAMARREGPPPPNFDELVSQAEEATEALVKLLTNNESTVGFKQHILEDKDANHVTEIIINSNWTVTFRSRSGRSDTDLAWIEKD